MMQWTKQQAGSLADQGFCGYVLKRGSPSCGLERVKVYEGSGLLNRAGRGLFAAGQTRLATQAMGGTVTYSINGRQYIAITAGGGRRSLP
jgi:uncharacterized protein YbbK (DUF523 family)